MNALPQQWIQGVHSEAMLCDGSSLSLTIIRMYHAALALADAEGARIRRGAVFS